MDMVLVPFLAFLAVMAIGGAIVVTRTSRRREIQERLRGLHADAEAPKPGGGRAGVVHMLRRVGTAVSHRGPSATLKEQLTKAGYHSASAAPAYLGVKMMLLALGLFGTFGLLLLTGLALQWCILVAALTGGLLSFIPNVVVSMRHRERSTNVRHHLPDAVDLLEVCVSSGMGMDMAWNVVTDEVRRVSAVLADEMALTNLEIHLGSQRAAAMRHLAERTGVEDIQSLVAVLTQSERFGTSVSKALRTFSSSMREGRSMRAQEEAERMAVRLLFPMVLLIFPALLIILVGPALMKLIPIITGS